MTNLRQAAEMALEALETLDVGDSYKTHNAASALRQALNQSPDTTKMMGLIPSEWAGLDEPPNSTTDVVEPEPVGQVVQAFDDLTAVSIPNMPPVGTKLYAKLPKREWVGLTDEDIEEIWGEPVGYMYSGHYYAIRDVEAKLKEKNT
jgi:hypothetical protein